MLFNSIEYALFLPVTLGAYWIVNHRTRIWVLVVSSYVFYAAWDWRFLFLIWLSTLVDYVAARALGAVESQAGRRSLVALSVAFNLGALGFFKYWGFFVDSAATLIERIGLQANVPTLSIILPVGISFYTFQTMSYTIDVFRKRLDPECDLRVVAAYVAFFPQLVAGPIERAERLMPQLRSLDGPPIREHFTEGAWLIGVGLVRKVILADTLAPIVDEFYGDPQRFGTVGAAMGVVAFSIQIYGDFAGYTDIARGSARLLGLHLTENFRQPYLARSITDFWRRWHVSLSVWLRDYLYIPLGGSRKGVATTARNLMVTMLLGGLWHGAAWGFVFWGFLHGLFLLLERTRGSLTLRREPAGSPVLVFVLVTLAWIPFRAESLPEVFDVAAALVRPSLAVPGPPLSTLIWIVFVVTVSFLMDTRLVRVRRVFSEQPLVAGALTGLVLITAVVASAGATSTPFLYFQF